MPTPRRYNVLTYMKVLVVSAAQQISFVLIHYVALAVAALLAYSIGRRLTRRLSYHSEFESIVFSTALGLGVIAYVIFLLGLLKLLYVPVLILALLLLFAFGFSELREVRRLRLSKRVAFRYLLIVVLATPVLLMPLYPVDGVGCNDVPPCVGEDFRDRACGRLYALSSLRSCADVQSDAFYGSACAR